MSAQAADRFIYKQEWFSGVAASTPIPFKPQDYGLEPQARHTGCHLGYYCDYAIEEDGLFLENLYMFNKEGNYPDFYGVSVSPPEFEEHERYVIENGKLTDKTERYTCEKYAGHRRYANVHMPIPYTGRILVGDRHISDFNVRVGMQRSFSYRVLKEFVIEDDRLVDIVDQSSIAKRMRKFVNRKDSIWWLKNWEQAFGEHMPLTYKRWWMR